MDVASEMKKQGIEIDDIRWYLACEEAKRVLTYHDEPEALSKLIHSGRLEADWYRMEERFTEELQEKLEARTVDDAEIRKTIGRIEASRRKRFGA